jgi:cyanoexosortase A
MNWSNRLQNPQFWLLGIAGAIVGLHLALVDRTGNQELFATSALFWAAAASLLWDKRHTLKLESGTVASSIGAVLLALVFLRSASLSEANQFLRFMPIVALFGLALLASGQRNLRQYRREFLIFGLFAAYPILEILLRLLDLSTLTAKVASFMLWYSGFPVQRQGVFLQLATGRVEVYEACSGLHSTLQMLSVSVLFVLTVTVRPLV